jgi:hypothetical protein
LSIYYAEKIFVGNRTYVEEFPVAHHRHVPKTEPEDCR